MSDRSHDAPATGRGLRRVLALSLLAGAAGCSSSPQYPINLGERGGDGSVMAMQPRYAVSAQDAAQNAADRRAQAGYPDYSAPPVADPSAPSAAPAADAPPPSAPSAGDDMADDAPTAPPQSAGAVESSDLPPPGAAAPAAGQPPPTSPYTDQGSAPPDAADVPPADPAASPHEVAYAYGGGRVVFGMDWVVAPQPELAAYRHRRHTAAKATSSADASSEASNTTGEGASASENSAKTVKSRRHRHGATTTAASDDTSTAPAGTAAADTPYQTVVKSGESLKEVAERAHTTREALIQLNDLKHPHHVKAGTVLKIPYRYSYEVQQGDTLYTIAHRFNQTPEEIARLNGLKAAPTLQPGQSIQLPPDASDQGKRDHASASGPEPEAAPTRLASAALRKAERKSRRSRAAELNSAEASLPPQEIRRTRREASDTSSLAAETGATTTQLPSSAPATREESRPAAVAVAPYVAPRPYVATPQTYAAERAASRPSAETSEARAATTASTETERTARPYTAPATTRSYASTAGATTPYAAPRPSTPAYGEATTASGGASPAYRPATSTPYRTAVAPAPSTYVAPAYGDRTAATAGATRYANLTPPRYTPGYPATGAAPGTSYTPSLGRERPAAPALSGGAATGADIAAAGRGRFIWPLRGPVVSAFGVKGTGEYNNGMDISAAPGTAVRAAAAGDVVYAGSSIPGYGNMVLIKHAGGWVTAYAHLNRIEVRMHDTVAQGEEIGQAGQTGVADRPELYFEVRYAASAADRPRPVDPALVLPAGGG